MLTSDLMKQVRYIELYTRHLVNDVFAGEYHSVFKGRGMTFNDVRPYQHGDEIRSIDWNVTARTGEAHVKRYVEERELTVMLVVDASASGDFGTVRRFKRELAAELAGVLAFAATTNNDRVGLLIFTDQIELLIPPRKGRSHVLRVIRELLAFEPAQRRTDLKIALDAIGHLLRRRSIVFLVSDFLTDLESYRAQLRHLNKQHDLIALDLNDPLEEAMPDAGMLLLEDAETSTALWVDTRDPSWRARFSASAQQLEQVKQSVFNAAAIDRVRVNTHDDYLAALMLFFKKRALHLRR